MWLRVIGNKPTQPLASYMKYVSLPCHHTFMSAMKFLRSLNSCKAAIADLYTIEEVETYMEHLSLFFATISERWLAATSCLMEYERLL
jgi:hypothetical protein